MNRITMLLIMVAAVLLAVVSVAQTPQAPARGARGGGGGTNGVNPGMDTGGAGIGSAEIAPMIFEEHWRDIPMSEPITHEHLTNQDLLLHIYGDSDHIRATQHPTEAYTY